MRVVICCLMLVAVLSVTAFAVDVFYDDVLISGSTGFNAPGETATLYLGDFNNRVNAVWGSGLRFSAYNAEDLLVLNKVTGNVGIGTVSPQHKIHVFDDTNPRIEIEAKSGIVPLSSELNLVTQQGDSPAKFVNLFADEQGKFGIWTGGPGGAGSTKLTLTSQGDLDVTGKINSGSKGLVYSTTTGLKKMVTTSVSVNTSISGGSSGGAPATVSFNFSESFSGTPVAWVRDITAGLPSFFIFTLKDVTSTGGTLSISNPTSSSATCNVTIRIVALGSE